MPYFIICLFSKLFDSGIIIYYIACEVGNFSSFITFIVLGIESFEIKRVTTWDELYLHE